MRRSNGGAISSLKFAVAVLCLITGPALAAPAPSGPDVAGYWKIDGRLAGHGIHLICHLDHDGPTLTGLCFGDGTPATGTFEEGHAVWQWSAAGHVLTFDAALNPDGQLKGRVRTVAFAGIEVSGGFTAQRPDPQLALNDPPQGMAALEQIIGDLARGQLTTPNCTDELAEGLRKQIAALQQVYQPLGPIKSLTFIDRLRDPRAKLATELYEVHFVAARRICSIDVTNKSKVSDLICQGE